MNPQKHIFVLILLLLAGLQVEAAHGEGSKTAADFKYCLLNDSFNQPSWELDLIAYFRPNQGLQKYRDTTSQYISPCDQILEEEAFTSPPGSLAPKVLCMLAEDLAKFPELRKLFDSAENVGGKFVRAWEKLSGLTGTREWTRRSVPLLKKMSDKSDDFMEKVRRYYSTHQKPTGTDAPPFTHQGTPFDDFGHPNFVPEVPSMSGQGKIKYKPVDIPNQPSLNGTTHDMTQANAWADQTYNVNGEIRFEGLSNGRCKIKKDNGEWVECVWQHHEDAKTMIPVPFETHNRAFPTGSPHTGGGSILRNPDLQDLIGFFSSPTGI